MIAVIASVNQRDDLTDVRVRALDRTHKATAFYSAFDPVELKRERRAVAKSQRLLVLRRVTRETPTTRPENLARAGGTQ